MKIPRDLNGDELARRLQRYGYALHHQTGSHIILKTLQNGEHTLSVPNHKPLKIGTLNALFNDIADHLSLDKQTVAGRLLSRK